MGDYAVNMIMVGVISWTSLFLLTRKLLRNRSFNFCSRIVSTCHATLVVTLACLSIQDWRCPVCPVSSQASPAQMKTLAVSLSYFIYDVVCSQFDEKTSTLDNSIHHLFTIVGMAAVLAYQKSGSETVATLVLSELSTPFLNMREFIKELGYRDTNLSFAADVAFAVIFSIARMVCGPYLTYISLSGNSPFLIKAMGLGLQLVSTFWFYKIVRMVQYKLAKRASSVKKTT